MVSSVRRALGALAGAFCATLAAGAAPAAAQFCEGWKGNSEIRCLSHVIAEDIIAAGAEGDKTRIFDTVTVQNKRGAHPVSFKYQVWQSICNLSGSAGPLARATLPPGESMHLDVHALGVVASHGGGSAFDVPAEGGGLGIDTMLHPFICTEVFFFDCTADGAAVHCMDPLGASVSRPAGQ